MVTWCYYATVLLRYRVTTNGDSCYYATVLLRYRVTTNGDLNSPNATVLLRYRVTTLPCYYATELLRYRVTTQWRLELLGVTTNGDLVLLLMET